MSINIVEDVVQISRETGGISINSLLVSIINFTQSVSSDYGTANRNVSLHVNGISNFDIMYII